MHAFRYWYLDSRQICKIRVVLPMRIVGQHAIKHWLSVLKEVHHGLEERDAHNAEEAQLGAGHTPLGGAVHEGADRHAARTLLVSLRPTLLRFVLYTAWQLKTASACVCDHGYILPQKSHLPSSQKQVHNAQVQMVVWPGCGQASMDLRMLMYIKTSVAWPSPESNTRVSNESAGVTNLLEELFFQLEGPAAVGPGRGRQVTNVGTLQHHLHTRH